MKGLWLFALALPLAAGFALGAVVSPPDAVAVAAVLEGRRPAGEAVQVKLPGGWLKVRVEPDLSRVWMRGEAVRVFQGELWRVG